MIDDVDFADFLDAFRETGLRPTIGWNYLPTTDGSPAYACPVTAFAVQQGFHPEVDDDGEPDVSTSDLGHFLGNAPRPLSDTFICAMQYGVDIFEFADDPAVEVPPLEQVVDACLDDADFFGGFSHEPSLRDAIERGVTLGYRLGKWIHEHRPVPTRA